MKVPASNLMRQAFAFDTMESEERVRAWLAELFDRYRFTPAARTLYKQIRVEIGDLTREWGGGFWYPTERVVQLRGCQAEAAIHELAHAWWHDVRVQGTNAVDLMVAVVKLTEEPDPRYARARELAGHYIYGIQSQPDPQSPTGWWRGMLVDGNDWEMFAGLASGVMADASRLPPYVRKAYRGLFEGA